jgi:branched-chain amino acid transport system permease protein
VTTSSTSAQLSSWAGLQRWARRDEVRRAASLVALMLTVAVITGPDGTQAAPYSGLRESLFGMHAVPFYVLAVILTALALTGGRWTATAGAPVRALRQRSRGFVIPKPAKLVALALLAVLLLYYPTTLAPFWQTVLVDQMGIYVLLAVGLNVVVGFAGLLDLGYIAFFAIGAYTTAYFTDKLPVHPPVTLNPFFVFPVAVGAALLAGVILGGPTLRLRGDYLAIVTLGFGEIVRITAVNSDSLTNGPQGAFGIPHFSAFGYHWTLDSLPYYYLLLAVVVLIVFFFRRLDDSRVGRAWAAIREDEIAAAATGIPTLKFKLMAFAIGASTSGFAGVIYASKVGFINPDNFPLLLSILVLTMVIFGGMGSIYGVILGAAVLGWLPNYLRDYVPAQDRFIYFGALLIVMMIFRPQGLLPSRRRSREFRLSEMGIGSADATGAIPGAQG